MTPEKRDVTNPMVKLAPRAAEIHLSGPGEPKVANEPRRLTEWGALFYNTPAEMRRWLRDRPQDWEWVKEL